MGLVSLLFSFRGRINRQQYWFGSMGVGFAGAMLIFAVVMMAAPLPGAKEAASPASFFLLIPIAFAMGWAGIAIQWKRFHDRGQPGWISLLPLLLLWNLGQTLIGAAFMHQPLMDVMANVQSHMFLMWGINIAFFINLGCLGGTDGPNKYGDPPGPWGRDAERPPSSAPSAPKAAKDAPMPAFLSGSALNGAASAIDRAIADGPRTMEPAMAVAMPAPATARAPAPSAAHAPAPSPGGFGRRAPSSGGFGQKR